FRARAALASAHLAEAAGRYDEALESILAGRRLMSDDPGRLEFEYECVNELMSVVLLAINALPYPTAMALAGRIDREFPGLPVSMPMMARQAKISRRRLAGDFDTLLRDDAALLERARVDRDVPAELDALRSLAATFAFANDCPQQIVLLEEALALEQTRRP